MDTPRSACSTYGMAKLFRADCSHLGQLIGYSHEIRGLRLRYIPVGATRQSFDAMLDTVQRGPVTIQRRNRDIAVVLSASEYRRLRALDVAEFQRCADLVGARAKARGLTGKKLRRILASEG
jgi:antitoxin Phd